MKDRDLASTALEHMCDDAVCVAGVLVDAFGLLGCLVPVLLGEDHVKRLLHGAWSG